MRTNLELGSRVLEGQASAVSLSSLPWPPPHAGAGQQQSLSATLAFQGAPSARTRSSRVQGDGARQAPRDHHRRTQAHRSGMGEGAQLQAEGRGRKEKEGRRLGGGGQLQAEEGREGKGGRLGGGAAAGRGGEGRKGRRLGGGGAAAGRGREGRKRRAAGGGAAAGRVKGKEGKEGGWGGGAAAGQRKGRKEKEGGWGGGSCRQRGGKEGNGRRLAGGQLQLGEGEGQHGGSFSKEHQYCSKES